MKLSVAVAGKSALPSAFVVWRGFEESIKKAADFGYHGVELALKTADEIDRDKLERWLKDNGSQLYQYRSGLCRSGPVLYPSRCRNAG